ncbi:MAG: ion channel [Paracoccaceae bacterium]
MYQLIWQLTLGSAVIAVAIAIQASMIGVAAMFRPHVARRLHRVKLSTMTLVISISALWMLAGMTVSVWAWAVTLRIAGAFDGLEPALYFALASYTTLGFGDLLPPQEWRILGAMIGANGMLGFGLATAAMVEFITRLRDDLASR